MHLFSREWMKLLQSYDSAILDIVFLPGPRKDQINFPEHSIIFLTLDFDIFSVSSKTGWYLPWVNSFRGEKDKLFAGDFWDSLQSVAFDKACEFVVVAYEKVGLGL